jgi:hypothetical protein
VTGGGAGMNEARQFGIADASILLQVSQNSAVDAVQIAHVKESSIIEV